MAWRNLAISALKLVGVTDVAAGLRHNARDLLRPLTLRALLTATRVEQVGKLG